MRSRRVLEEQGIRVHAAPIVGVMSTIGELVPTVSASKPEASDARSPIRTQPTDAANHDIERGRDRLHPQRHASSKRDLLPTPSDQGDRAVDYPYLKADATRVKVAEGNGA